jgi:hypothetical protein
MALTGVISWLEEILREERASWRWSLRTAAIVSTVQGSFSEECGYLLSMWKFASRSAVRLEVGEEPRVGLSVK